MRHLGTKQLETERLILRKYTMKDATDMFANWVTDPEVARFWEWEPHENIASTQTLLEEWIGEYKNPECYHWVIISKADSQAIGYIYLNNIDDCKCSADVHYLLSRRYWNQGLMSEACRKVIEFSLYEVGFLKICSYHHCDNPASGRVMQKCGMRFVKTEHKTLNKERLSGEYRYYEIEACELEW